MIQIVLSLVVLHAVVNRRPVFFLYAIALHSLINLPDVFPPAAGLGIWTTELYVMAIAALALYWIIRARNVFRDSSPNIDS